MFCILAGTIYPMFIIPFHLGSHNCSDSEINVKTYVDKIISADELNYNPAQWDSLLSGKLGL